MASATAWEQSAPGGYSYSPLTEINEYVMKIANFAVVEYGKESGTKVRLSEVIKGESSQVNEGINYRLTLSVVGEDYVSNIYEAVVWESLLLPLRILVSFIRL
ncbi:cysteine proteinase inhibitor 5-like [Vicia villosa]|uniref:cysteine proteinase inhibitor 5-like n=1 Tax=Vicia villosa TaxID=3911 RepID=UPI00273AD4CD|nr:cysteine proteinase inhibitor 5-like [Vicia villosa]